MSASLAFIDASTRVPLACMYRQPFDVSFIARFAANWRLWTCHGRLPCGFLLEVPVSGAAEEAELVPSGAISVRGKGI